MAGIIFWIIIIIVIVNSSLKKKQREQKKQEGVQEPAVLHTQSRKQTAEKKVYEKPLPKQKVHKQKDSGILQRAKASVAEDFEKKGPKEYHQQKMFSQEAQSGNPQSKVQTAAALKREMTQREAGSFVEEAQDLLETVNDLMVKGIDTRLTYERDFVGEGMDMLNRIQSI